MAKTIIHELVFENTTPETLYDLYMDAAQHSMIAGAPAEITTEEGAAYSVHNGYITGRNLHLVEDKLIVQTWRAMDWGAEIPDSTFIIHLEPQENNVVLLATHANVPDEKVESIDKGWHGHYWGPWKQHLAGEEITRPQM